MRTDGKRLYVAGGLTGTVFVYDKKTAAFIGKASNGLPSTDTVLNDLVVTPSGVYVTDLFSPSLWRVRIRSNGKPAIEKWLDFRGTAFEYTTGLNADGIQATPDGRFLIIGATNTGKLYRVDLRTKAVAVIDTGGADLTNADGIELVGHDLYVARNANDQIVKVELSDHWSTGTVETITTSPRFDYTVALAAVGSRLLVLNSQFEHLQFPGSRPPAAGPNPTLAFTVTNINRP